MLYITIYVLTGLLIISIMAVLWYKGKMDIISRAIYIANKKTNFINEIEKWDETTSNSPFDKGIDPYDVYATLSDCDLRGRTSINKELKKYGNISQL